MHADAETTAITAAFARAADARVANMLRCVLWQATTNLACWKNIKIMGTQSTLAPLGQPLGQPPLGQTYLEPGLLHCLQTHKYIQT